MEVRTPSGKHVHAHAVLRELASLAIVRTDLGQSKGELFQRQIIEDGSDLCPAPNMCSCTMAPMHEVPLIRIGYE